MITIDEVLDFQKSWADGIILIGNLYRDKGNYYEIALEFIDKNYAYDYSEVLFKPTLAVDVPFRLDKVSALSYFIGENIDYPEDIGFAIKGWNNVRWENAGININNDSAICMGHYFFSKKDDEELMVEFSLVIRKFDGILKLVLHDSHLPYTK
jgi:hypothetical protein